MTTPETTLGRRLLRHIRDIPDFPKPGVTFKDITPLLADPAAFAELVEALAGLCTRYGATKVAGLEARGFVLAAPVAIRAGVGFVPIRKAGKLPAATLTESYELEYGTAQVEVHQDAFTEQDRVLLVDDVLATGGTAAAGLRLVRRAGATVVGVAMLLELGFLGGRARIEHGLGGVPLDVLITVD
ncbi:adenine phosphoribosyltransferase [Amycolatopsis suaedae]|uniref:Adenine phosphoribosyltransferase n=1 Tax=Amycolatopsis suaedae TaxID=2510978 RepID=A0A4Q7J8M7_9PSEU|nr:adenine phosphoribosyltransferase [Amycolatopsis suaedae]RZQ63338.1 adenine phosphoribosyltransferase [Amycolatopsis suaedae]